MILSGLAVDGSYGHLQTAYGANTLSNTADRRSRPLRKSPAGRPVWGRGESSGLRSAGRAPPLKIIKLARLSGVDHGCHLFRPSPGCAVVA